MKSFQFRLQRPLEWRGTQLEAERQKLQALLAELDKIQASIAEIRSVLALNVRDSMSGDELAAFARYGERLRRNLAELTARQPVLTGKIVAQRASLREAHRRLELLQRLKDRQQERWRLAMEKELEEFAGESFLGRWSGRS